MNYNEVFYEMGSNKRRILRHFAHILLVAADLLRHHHYSRVFLLLFAYHLQMKIDFLDLLRRK